MSGMIGCPMEGMRQVRIGAALGLLMLAASVCVSGAAEARRDTALILVGAVVPSPGCVASVAVSGVPAVACSGAVAFVVQTIRVRPAAVDPGLAAPDAFQVTVTY
jgi:hypothetical protein